MTRALCAAGVGLFWLLLGLITAGFLLRSPVLGGPLYLVVAAECLAGGLCLGLARRWRRPPPPPITRVPFADPRDDG